MGSLFKKPKVETGGQNPWAPAQEDLKTILGEGRDIYQKALDAGYISSTGDLAPLYQEYLQGLQGMAGNQQQVQDIMGQGVGALGEAQDLYRQLAGGGMNISDADVLSGAGQYMDSDLLNQQIEAATRGDVRNLTENLLPSIDRGAIASGNLGSSRAGVAQGIATRGTQDRIADVSAQMRGNAYQDALNRSYANLAGNRQAQLGGIGGLGTSGQNMLGAAGQITDIGMGALEPYLKGGQLGQLLQQQQQADLIGGRDYQQEQLQKWLEIAGRVGGMGSVEMGQGSSLFDKATAGVGLVGDVMGLFE